MKRVGEKMEAPGLGWRSNESHVVVEMAVQPRLRMEISVMLPPSSLELCRVWLLTSRMSLVVGRKCSEKR
jgi:hypothetical protein